MPADNPILGHLNAFRNRPLEVVERAREWGDLVRWRFGPYWFYQVNHPDIVRQVLVQQAGKFRKTDRNKAVFQEIMGDGLLVSDGAHWRRQRKLVTPAFHPRRIQSYGQEMVALTEVMLGRWRPGETIDLGREMMELTLAIVAKTLFNVDLGDEVFDRVDRAMTAAQDRANRRFRQLFTWPRWVPTAPNRAAAKAVNDLDAVLGAIVEERRAHGHDRGDLLSMLLLTRDEAGARMTDEEVRDEAMTLFLAGHETTANALTWAWTLLARHPQVEDELRSEVGRLLGDRPPVMDDLDRLGVTRAVIEEAMRLYPPAWIIARQAKEDLVLADNRLERGSVVFISQWALHRDERYFRHPLEFRPDRFADGQAPTWPKYAYIPFGGGPRICIGNQFALVEAQLALATMVRSVHLEMDPGQDLTPEPLVTLRPKVPIKMKVQRLAAAA